MRIYTSSMLNGNCAVHLFPISLLQALFRREVNQASFLAFGTAADVRHCTHVTRSRNINYNPRAARNLNIVQDLFKHQTILQTEQDIKSCTLTTNLQLLKMPLVVPGLMGNSGDSKTDEWTNKLVGKKLSEQDSNETVGHRP